MAKKDDQTKATCLFCQMISGEEPADVIDETEKSLTILSLENHPLVIPKKHLKNIYELDRETGCELATQTARIARAVKKGLEADGVYISQLNEPAAGQEIFHLHVHIIPRYDGKSKLKTQDRSQIYKQKLVNKIKAELDKDN